MNQLPSNAIAPLVNMPFSIPTYIINLKKRADRKAHVLEQFQGRDEFSLRIVEAFENSFGALGLWMTIRYILHDLAPDNAEYIIICEDDIEFTEDYSKEYLLDAIDQAKEKNADILLGGVSWFGDMIQVSEQMFWTNNFSGLHFTIIFKKFFRIILDNKLRNYDAADHYLAKLTNNVLLLYPFLAIQKDFGYSDATTKNNVEGRVKSLFEATTRRFAILNKINSVYKNLAKDADEESADEAYDKIIIPTYVINLPERTERLEHIKQQFTGKPEFDVQIIEACKHEVGALGLWLSIRKIINLAIANDDDVIVICEDDHQFTEYYTKEYLIKNIIDAHEEGVSFLSGGTGKFNDAIPITKNRYWVQHCLSTQFVVVYKKFFHEILDHPYDETIVADLAYSHLALNKMVLYPFISTQKDFGYSDVTSIHTEVKNLIANMFAQSNWQFRQIQQAYLKYHPEENIIKSIEKYA
jgi:GR25 family glycosyltransferase involved in LPS biosynthesis